MSEVEENAHHVNPPIKKRGLASVSLERRRAIASLGGKAAHALGTAHKWTSEEAQAAGRIGGRISKRRPKYPQAS